VAWVRAVLVGRVGGFWLMRSTARARVASEPATGCQGSALRGRTARRRPDEQVRQQLVRTQAYAMVPGGRHDDHLVDTRLVDEGGETATYGLGAADERVLQHRGRLHLLHRRPHLLDVVYRRRQQPRRAADHADELLLDGREE